MKLPRCIALCIGTVASVLSLTLASDLVGAADAWPTLNVYVRPAMVERLRPDKATKSRLKLQVKATRRARKELEKQLRSQYGKRREEWPREMSEALIVAEEAANAAETDYDYREPHPEDLRDSAADIRRALAGRGHVALVNTREEADLVVTVVGRRTFTDWDDDLRTVVCFTIGAGSKLDATRLHRIPRDWRNRDWWRRKPLLQMILVGPYEHTRTVHGYTTEAPYWKFEAQDTHFWSDAADRAAKLIVDFIAENHSALKDERTY